jgi:hypothetical protein
MPTFAGPWAAEFADNWAHATTDFERDVLADGVISELEYAEMTERLDRCLGDAGVQFGGFADNGGYEFSFPESTGAEKANEITEECEKTSGEWTVNTLYSMISHNPENIDDSILMAECLIEAGVVSPGYTAADWDAEMENPTALTEPGGPPEVWECNDDPLGLFDD